MKRDSQDWLILGGLAVGLYVAGRYLLRGSLTGLGDADPDKLDVSKAEDLCNAVANLIGTEQHLVSSAARTGDAKYVGALNRVREMRRSMMAKLLPADAKGEAWCLTKHLLAGSLHAREVGDKCAAEGDQATAQEWYKQSQELKDSAIALASTASSGGQCPVCKGG